MRKKISASLAGKPEKEGLDAQISQQFQAVESHISRGRYNEALQMLDTGGFFGIPDNLQEEWSKLTDRLREQFAAKQTEALEKWGAVVNQLVADVKQACLEAKNSGDLDSAMLKCTGMQMRRDRSGGPLSDRIDHKLQGAITTLTAWANYLDFRDAGKAKAANDALRSLNQQTGFPVLSVQEIDAHVLSDPADPERARAAVNGIMRTVQSPDDLPAALAKLEKLIPANPTRTDVSWLSNDQRQLRAVSEAWIAAKAGDDAGVSRALEQYAISGGSAEVKSALDQMLVQVLTQQLEIKAKAWTKLSPNPGEDARSYVGRILDELQAAKNYKVMLEVLNFAEQPMRYQKPLASLQKERTAIDQFLAAQRFEQLNDTVAAVTNYRFVVGSAGGKYVPMEEAEAALKRLREKDPEAFKSYEGVLAEELRVLRQQMQSLTQLLMNRPMIPGRPYPY